MADNIWHHPEDPDSRSFRWRENRRRAAEQEAAETWVDAPKRDPLALEDGDMRGHSMFGVMAVLTAGLGAITATLLLVLALMFGTSS